MERPLGVTLIAILSLLSGLGGVLKGLALLGVGGLAIAAIGGVYPVAGAIIGGIAGIAGIIGLVNGLFTLGFSYGAWKLKGWAWAIGVATQWAAIIWSGLVILGPGVLRGQLGHLLVAGVVLFYLYTPEVKRAFGRA